MILWHGLYPSANQRWQSHICCDLHGKKTWDSQQRKIFSQPVLDYQGVQKTSANTSFDIHVDVFCIPWYFESMEKYEMFQTNRPQNLCHPNWMFQTKLGSSTQQSSSCHPNIHHSQPSFIPIIRTTPPRHPDTAPGAAWASSAVVSSQLNQRYAGPVEAAEIRRCRRLQGHHGEKMWKVYHVLPSGNMSK